MSIYLNDFYYIRHGQTDWNNEGRCIGQQDIPLNMTGVKQAEQARRLLSHCKIKTICYSPLLRAKQTALILNESLNCPLIEIPELKECCWGSLEGQLKKDRAQLNRWIKGEELLGAEPYNSFMERALIGINEALSYPTPLIVAHSGTYWAILKTLELDHHHRTAIPNCVPVYHRPPIDESDSWIISLLDEVVDERSIHGSSI